MYDKEGPNLSAEELINIAPGEGNIPVSFTSEPNWEALCLVKELALGYNHFAEEKEFPITLSTYVHGRLKCCDNRFASNPQYIFQCFDWTECNAVASSIHFAERKQCWSVNKLR